MKHVFLWALLILGAAACSSAEVNDNSTGPGDCGLSKQEIDTAIRAHFAEKRDCHKLNQPGMAGRIVARFDILADGSVAQPSVASTTLQNNPLEDCLILELRKIRFPAVRCGGTVSVDYPFVFTPRKQ